MNNFTESLRNAMSDNIRAAGEPQSPRVKGLTMAWDQFLKTSEPSGETFVFGAMTCGGIVENPHAHLEDLDWSKWDPVAVHAWSPPPELLEVRAALLKWCEYDGIDTDEDSAPG